MNPWILFYLLTLVLLLFQNCSSFESDTSLNFYPYKSKPDFFHDLKLISAKTDDSNRKQYIIDFAVSYSEDPLEDVDYEVKFSTLKIPHVCKTLEGVASDDKKHFLASCLIPVSSENLFIQLSLQGPDDKRFRKVYEF